MNVAERFHRRPRVLQLSYACSPVRGSEAGVGWRRAVQSAKYFDTWVICEEHEFAADIRQYLAKHGDIPGLNFVFVPIDQREWRLGQIHDAVWYAVLHRWHRKVLGVARRLHEQIRFDLVHQVTFCGYREPGYLWKLDTPFVWGPIGGAQNYPWRFLPYAGFRGAMKEACRSILNSLQLRFSRRVRSAAKKASIILAANSTNQESFAGAYGAALPILADVGIDVVSGEPRTIPHAGPLRLLWSGRLLDCKALHLLLYAMARLPADAPCELRVLGDGPLKARWQRLAHRLGVGKQIAWMGWLPHREAIEQYAWADAFVFSSLRDTTGTVVVEALAAGLPILCLDHQGMHDVVTGDCGIKIPVTTPRRVIAGLSEAIARLAHDPIERRRLARGAIERAKQYLWSRQEDQMADVYDRVLADNNSSVCRNTNGMPGESNGPQGSEPSAFAGQPIATHA